MKLVTGPFSLFGTKVEVALAEKGIDAEIEFVPYSFKTHYEPKHPEVLRLNPKKQVPVLIDGDLEIFDSSLINEYLEDLHPSPALWPSDPKARAEARLWELKSDEVLFPLNITVRDRLWTPDKISAEEAEAAMREASAFLADLDRRLEGRDYVCDAFSYADIALFFSTFFAALMRLDKEAGPHLRAWRSRMLKRPSVAPTFARLQSMLKEAGLPQPQWE